MEGFEIRVFRKRLLMEDVAAMEGDVRRCLDPMLKDVSWPDNCDGKRVAFPIGNATGISEVNTLGMRPWNISREWTEPLPQEA